MGVRVKDDNGSLKRWESDLAGWEMPRMYREMFYAHVDALLAETKAYTHVKTGSLQISGAAHITYDATRSVLEAQITYGGPAAGAVHDPVRYAVYEQARGIQHDPLAPLYASAPRLETVFSQKGIVTGGIL